MRQLKTNPTKISVKAFLSSIRSEKIRKDSHKIAALMEKATKAKPKMWGKSIIGFGASTLKYADGSEREWMRLAFAPREKISRSIYPFSRDAKTLKLL